jgi:hypothetical protein
MKKININFSRSTGQKLSLTSCVRSRILREALCVFLLTACLHFLLTSLFSTGDEEDTPERGDLVIAFYYPWYEAGNWNRHPVADAPILGPYGTDNNVTVSTHISWANQYKVNGFALSWNGAGQMADTHIVKGFLGAVNVRDTSFMIFYESLGRLSSKGESQYIDFREEGVYEKFETDLIYIQSVYFTHPSYLKLDGRPIIGLYVTRVWRNFSRQILDKIRERLNENIYFLGDEAFLRKQSRPETALNGLHPNGPVFDAYMSYNMFENGYVKDGESSLSFYERVSKPVFENWCGKVTFFPTLLPEYNDFRGNKPLHGSSEDFRSQIASARTVCNRPLSRTLQSIILVTSFNEWFEGTSIEPSKRVGYSYLSAINASFSKHAVSRK